jgi:cyclopropane fatty-acyl-phospholipid synthase-like methyltransferase
MLATSPDHQLIHARYPRSNAYDPDWVIKNQMGPNALWLAESLSEVLEIKPSMRVLDLGCGRAMSSLFLAQEFGARVWATDLWVPASDNQRRIVDAGLDDLVMPVHAEAHALPFAAEFFDAIVSLDAYQYFGTSDLYLGYLVEFLKRGGQIGAVVPAMLHDPDVVPEHLAAFWDWEFCCFHSPGWWRRHWCKTGKVRVDGAAAIEEGWRDWLVFNDITAPSVTGWRADDDARSHDMLEADRGRHLGFARTVATRP